MNCVPCFFIYGLLIFSLCRGARILPYKFTSPECLIPEDQETCSLQEVDGIYKGRRHWKSPNKYVLLWPMPHGNYERARRLCHACDLEIAEVWDEDDANQIMELINTKDKLDTKMAFKNASFWLGEVQQRSPDSPTVPSGEIIQSLKFLHQDGITPVRFHYLRGVKSFDLGYSTPSGLPDGLEDCIVIGPDPKQKDKISWFVQSCRARSNFGLCQFKRKHHCYDETPTAPTRQMLVASGSSSVSNKSLYKPQPYHLSNYPLSWSLAKETCERDKQSLLYFNSKDEEQYFTLAFGKLLAEREHLEPGFWSAGHFERELLRWWRRDDILTIPKYRSKEMQWNFALTNATGQNKLRKKTNLDFSGGDGCVYFEGKGTSSSSNKWGIAECDRSMRFFVCKDSDFEFQRKSSVEYCDGKNYVKKERYECKWNLVLKKEKPQCACIEGVHGLTDHASCNSRLLIGPKCIKLSKKGVVHWKILSRSWIERDAWLIVQLRSQKSGRFIEWFTLQTNSSRQIFGNANVYYSGLRAVQFDSRRICFERHPSAAKGDFNELKIRNTSSSITYAFQKCSNGTFLSFRTHKFLKSKNECELEPCKKPLQKLTGSLAPKPTPDVYPEIPEEIKSSNNKLNEKMLAHKIDKAFKKAHPIGDAGRIWQILRKLMDILTNLCSCMVDPNILNDAFELFHVAHAGQAYRYLPTMTNNEASEILEALNTCEQNVKMIPCETHFCTGRTIKATDKQSSVDDSGLQGTRHHHVLEIIWIAVSSWNVACLKHFKSSYLNYHHLEQALEELFTEEMLKLWHYPSVDPNYFQMLLGPFEATHIANLKHCANAIYGGNLNILELSRPKLPKGKYLGERIRDRKSKDKQEAEGYEALSHLKNQVSPINSSHKSNNVFCSRDEYCLKW